MGRAKASTARGDQPNIPGAGDERNERVHRAAKQYAARRDERMAANEEEKAAHTKLLETMLEEGLDSYRYGDVEVNIDNTRKCKVRIGGEPKPDTTDEE